MFKRAAALFTIAVALTLIVSTATASVGRFYSTAQITQNGHSAKVGGPWAWDYDEECAVIHVQLVQNGNIAHGDSSMIFTRDSEWHATITTIANNTLQPGSANVRATADVENEDGSHETYTWTQTITLR